MLVVLQYSPNKAHQLVTHSSIGYFFLLPGMSGEGNDAASAYTQVKVNDAHQFAFASGNGLPQQFGSGFLEIVVQDIGKNMSHGSAIYMAIHR